LSALSAGLGLTGGAAQALTRWGGALLELAHFRQGPEAYAMIQEARTQLAAFGATHAALAGRRRPLCRRAGHRKVQKGASAGLAQARRAVVPGQCVHFAGAPPPPRTCSPRLSPMYPRWAVDQADWTALTLAPLPPQGFLTTDTTRAHEFFDLANDCFKKAIAEVRGSTRPPVCLP